MGHSCMGQRTRLARNAQLALLALVLMAFCGLHPVSRTFARAIAETGTRANSDQITIGIWISDRDLAEEKQLLSSRSRPGGSRYHQWFSAAQFQARFAPMAADVSAVRRFLTDAHLRVLPASNANLQLASGTITEVEQAFQVPISTDGLYYYTTEKPRLPTTLSRVIAGVFGLTNRPLERANNISTPEGKNPDGTSLSYGGGVDGSGLTPLQIAGIYNAIPLYQQDNKGQGTTLGLAEFSGYTDSDITFYENAYRLPHMKLVDVPVIGGATDHSGAAEVEMDIELQIAMAPRARRLLVYSAPRNDLGILAMYQRLAQDNLADVISTSWGMCEYLSNNNFLQAENQIFLRMALQGQSMFAASGDQGAYDCAGKAIPPAGEELQADDPGSQPYVTSVGGTSFQGSNAMTHFNPGTNTHPNYPGQLSEKPWIEFCNLTRCEASGGGVSHFWAEPEYALQSATGAFYPGIVGPYSHSGSYCQQSSGVLCREVPDVSLNADPQTRYSMYCTDAGDSSCTRTGWIAGEGTSATAPLWAGIAALAVRQNQSQRLGLLNYLLYPFDSPTGYTHQFHDIISNISNGQPFYNALNQLVSGYTANRAYDLVTGIGTPNIAQLVESLVLLPVPGRG